MDSNDTSYLDLMDGLDETQIQVIGYIDIATSALSLLGSGSIIISALWRQRVCTPEVQPIFHLSCADFLASSLLFISAILYSQQHNLNLSELCPFLTSFTCAFFVSTYFLTMNYAFEVYRRMNERLKKKNKNKCGCCSITVSFFIYSLVWIVPIGISLIAVLHTRPAWKEMNLILPSEHLCQRCLPIFHYIGDICLTFNDVYLNWNFAFKLIFLCSLCVVFTANFIFYMLAMRTYRKSLVTRGVLGYQQYKEEAKIRNKAIFYQLVFIFCWLPSVVLGFFTLSDGFKMKDFYWLYVWQAAVSPLQGFFNCVVYGWQRQGFKQALSEETKSLTSTNSPTYSTFRF